MDKLGFSEIKEYLADSLAQFKSAKDWRAAAVAVITSVLLVVGTALSFIFGAKWYTTGLQLVGISLVYFANLFRRKGELKSEPIEPIDFSVLSGAAPIRVGLGSHVKEWGRQSEIAELSEWILGEEVAVILLWGAPGVGKTSLANAGLRSELTSAERIFLNVDTSRENFRASLVEQLREGIENAPDSFEPIIRTDRKRKQVVLLDNASFAVGDSLDALIDLAKLALDHNAPHKRVFVIVIDEAEFRETWQKQPWVPKVGGGLRRKRIANFTVAQALDVLIALKREA